MSDAVKLFWILIACYGLFFFESFMAWKGSLHAKTALSHSISSTIIKNIVGIIILGLPLILFYNCWHQFIALPMFNSPFQLLMIFFLLMIAVHISLGHTMKSSQPFFERKKRNELVLRAPQISYLTIRVAFLVIYECFFRGLLLFISAAAFGTTAAIAINILLYAGIHAFHGRNEILACIPFGLFVCGITIWYQSIFPAIAVHLVLALVNEIYLLFFFVPKPKTVRL